MMVQWHHAKFPFLQPGFDSRAVQFCHCDFFLSELTSICVSNVGISYIFTNEHWLSTSIFFIQLISMDNSGNGFIKYIRYVFVTTAGVVVSCNDYNDVIMGATASQTTSLSVVYSSVYSDADQRKHQNRWPVNSPHKWPVTRKMFPFDDVIMTITILRPGFDSWELQYFISIYFHFYKQCYRTISTSESFNRSQNASNLHQFATLFHFHEYHWLLI